MASSQSLETLLCSLDESKLPEATKNLILRIRRAKLLRETDNGNDKLSDKQISSCGSLNKVHSTSSAINSGEIIADEFRSNLKVSETLSVTTETLNVTGSDDMATEHDEKQKYLDKILALAEEEDLLSEIAMKESESSSDSDDDERLLTFEYSTNLQNIDPKQMVNNKLSLFEKQKVPALQIGLAVPDPVLNVGEAKFSNSVLRILKEIKFYGPSCIQSVAWPAVERGRDMFVVAPPHSGKTVSYVLPLVSRFSTRETAEGENKGPHTIVLCSSWRKAQAVDECFKLFLGDIKKKIFTLYTDGGHYKHKVQSVINSCDILIATPHCLLVFLQKKMISFASLEEFVLDDGSTVMKKHKKELKEIILCIMEAIKKTECCPQLILCTDRWNKNFQVFVDKVMRNPLLYFTSFLEAAIYARISIIDHVCDSKEAKRITLYGLVKKAARKIVVCTTNVSEAVEVHQFLKCLRCQSYLINEDMEHFVADDVIKCWKTTDGKTTAHCLVVTDQVLTDMCITNADCLIHFDVPSESRLQFGNRFSAIAEHFVNKESSSKCVCHVLILESEHFCATSLVEVIENSGGIPSEKLVALSKMQNKDENASGDLCPYMKAFGACERRCRNRHTINPTIDKPQIGPYEGDIHGIVTHVIDASHYYVRLVKYLDPITNKTVSLVGTYTKIGFQLRDFYLHSTEEMKVETPIIGDNYVIEEENELFYRVKILRLIPECTAHIAQWRVLFLDEGWVKYCQKPKLYKLTDQIDLPKPLAVEVYACNMAPPDSSFDWNPQTSHLASDLLKGKEIHGKIVLCIGRTLWLDPLAVTIRLSDGNYVYPFKVDQKLIDCGHAIKRKSHLESLHKVCAGKIPLPHVTKPKVKEEKVDECELSISYAFLDCDVHEDVYVSSVVSPNQLYVQRAKFVGCLDDLLDKINAQAEKKKLKRAYTIFKDMVCIAPFFEDNRYYRAIVTDLLSYDEIKVFFVDFGDTGIVARKDIYSTTAEFLLLPFQAIECELAGINVSHGGWTESAISTFTAMTRDEAYDMKILQLKAYSKTSSYSSGNRYVIDLWDNDKKLSEQLIQAGFGDPVEFLAQETNDNSPAQSSDALFDVNDECSPSSSGDEDMDPEDKNITAQFYGLLAKMMAEQYDLFPLPKRPGTEDSDDDEEILKKCNITSLPSFNGKSDNFKNLLPKLNNLNKILPSSKLPSNSLRPLITWWDTPEELNILINLKDVKIYELDVTDENLNFNTIVSGTQYTTEEKFYEKINSSDAKICQIVQGISIVAKKCTPFKWPRLTKEKKKFFHIKYDLVHIEDSDTEEDSKADKAKSKIQRDMRYAYEDENDSSTDEDEKYVEPWKEFAQNKDPASDLLTEM